MSEKRFRFEKECTENFFSERGVFYNNERPMGANEIIGLLNSLSEENEQLKEENEMLQKNMENLQEVVAELGATLLMNGFEIEINGENLSELIKSKIGKRGLVWMRKDIFLKQLK